MCNVHLQNHSEWGKESCLVTQAASKECGLVTYTGRSVDWLYWGLERNVDW